MIAKVFSIFFGITLLGCSMNPASSPENSISQLGDTNVEAPDYFPTLTGKIAGASLEAPPRPIDHTEMSMVKKVNANWVAIIPYAFSQPGEPDVRFEHQGWWGERIEGVAKCVQMAHEQGLKVMLKPHVWVRRQGWPGEYDLPDDKSWKEWEENYTRYIETYARVADSLKVELLCIGTEYRIAVRKRPLYWKNLIAHLRKVYDGEITYASNWDNFNNVTFWDDVDYIGIDAYFPLSTDKSPRIGAFIEGWNQLSDSLESFSISYNKPILFTEYGFKSIDYTSAGHWNYKEDTLSVNLLNQVNAYEGFFQSIWQEEWLAGGFFWKWHMNYEESGGSSKRKIYTSE